MRTIRHWISSKVDETDEGKKKAGGLERATPIPALSKEFYCGQLQGSLENLLEGEAD